MSHILESFDAMTLHDKLRPSIEASKHGIVQNNEYLFGMLELYNLETCTFFTPIGKLGMSLEEMYVVSGLPPSEYPSEEYMPYMDDLNELDWTNPDMYQTYLEVLCHLFICQKVHKKRNEGMSYLVRARNPFPICELGEGVIGCQPLYR